MYKLLIVEDEPIERKAMKLMIAKNCPEIGSIEEAQDGYEALERCVRFLPDIVMVDINMPGINGLETIHEMQNKPGVHAKFLILTSYDKFDFAQEAVRLGVEDYILKPAKIARLQEAIAQTVAKLESERKHVKESSALVERMARIRPIVESDCVYALISGDGKTMLDAFFQFLNVEVQSGFCLIVSCPKMSQLLLTQLKTELQNLGLLVIGQRYNNRLVFFVLSPLEQTPNEAQEVAQYVRLSLLQRKLDGYVAQGQIYAMPEQLHLSYRDARGNLKLLEQDASGTPQTQEMRRLAQKQNQMLLQEQTTQDDFDALAHSVMLMAQASEAREILYRLLVLAGRMVEEHCPWNTAKIISMDEMLQMGTPRELIHCYSSHMAELHSVLRAKSGEDFSSVAKGALRFMEAHYCENITLEDVAEHLQVTANYVSRALKKQTGQTFSDLIAEKRIRCAKELLHGTMSMKEITYKVGLNSQNYFTKIFKKMVGITPTEYKAKMSH